MFRRFSAVRERRVREQEVGGGEEKEGEGVDSKEEEYVQPVRGYNRFRCLMSLLECPNCKRIRNERLSRGKEQETRTLANEQYDEITTK